MQDGESPWLSRRLTLLANLLGVSDKSAGGNHDAWTDSKIDFCLGFIARCLAFDAVAQTNPGIVSKVRGSFPQGSAQGPKQVLPVPSDAAIGPPNLGALLCKEILMVRLVAVTSTLEQLVRHKGVRKDLTTKVGLGCKLWRLML